MRDPVTYHTTSEWNVKQKEGLAEKWAPTNTRRRARLAAAESERDSALVNLQWRNELVGQMRQQQQTLLEHVHVLKHKYDIAKVSSSLQGGAAARTCSPVSRYVPVCAGGESNAPVAGLAE